MAANVLTIEIDDRTPPAPPPPPGGSAGGGRTSSTSSPPIPPRPSLPANWNDLPEVPPPPRPAMPFRPPRPPIAPEPVKAMPYQAPRPVLPTLEEIANMPADDGGIGPDGLLRAKRAPGTLPRAPRRSAERQAEFEADLKAHYEAKEAEEFGKTWRPYVTGKPIGGDQSPMPPKPPVVGKPVIPRAMDLGFVGPPTEDDMPTGVKSPRRPKADPIKQLENRSDTQGDANDLPGLQKNELGSILKQFGGRMGLSPQIAQMLGQGGMANALAGGAMGLAGGGGAMKALGGAAMGAAGGPIGLGLMAADKLGEGFDKLRGRIEGFGQVAVKVANNDGFGLLKGAVHGYADFLEETLPVQGKVMAAMIKAEFAVVDAFKMASDAFIARGKELQGYNIDLAQANANADVRSLMADINEAERLGPAIARLTEAQSKADAEFREAILPLKEAMANGLAGIMERVAKVLEYGQKFEPAIEALTMVGRMAIAVDMGKVASLIDVQTKVCEWVIEKLVPFWVKDKWKKDAKKKDKEMNEIMQQVLGLSDPPMRPWQGGPDPVGQAAQQRLGMPLLG